MAPGVGVRTVYLAIPFLRVGEVPIGRKAGWGSSYSLCPTGLHSKRNYDFLSAAFGASPDVENSYSNGHAISVTT